MNLTKDELITIEESLQYTKRAFQDYQHYPNREFKLERIKYIEGIIEKVREAKRTDNENPNKSNS